MILASDKTANHMRCFSDLGHFNIFQFLPTNIQIPLKHEKSILLFRLKTTIEEAGAATNTYMAQL